MQTLTDTAYDNPLFHHSPIRHLRRRWATLLQYCDSASQHEDPLYAFYGEIFSTLSKIIVPHNAPTFTDSLYFSYPQCHLARKHGISDLSDRVMYTVPDFAFLYIKMASPANGGKVEEESAVFLTEIKRLYDERLRKPLPFVISPENELAFSYTFGKSIRQLLVQAFCGWHVFNQPHINLKFICGIYFTLIRFTRPSQLHPLPALTVSTGEKRKYDDLVNTVSTTKDIPSSDIAQWVPRQSVEVIYWKEVVTDDPRNPELHLSASYRSCFKFCLKGTDSQPSGLFDVTEAELEGSPASDVVYGENAVSAWYLAVKQSLEPRTPPRMNSAAPPDNSTSSPEQDTSSPYKDRAVNVSPLRMELRSTAAQKLRKLKS